MHRRPPSSIGSPRDRVVAEGAVVQPPTDHPAVAGNLALARELELHIRERRAAGQVGAARLLGVKGMDVRVDEPGNDLDAVGSEDLRARVAVLADLRVGADGNDLPSAHGDRARPRKCRIERPDRSPENREIGTASVLAHSLVLGDCDGKEAAQCVGNLPLFPRSANQPGPERARRAVS